MIAVLRCSSLSTVVMSASSTSFSRIRHHAALLCAVDRCQLPRQLPRAQSFAIDYHLFSPVLRAFLCPQSLPGSVGRLAPLGACGLFGGAVSGCVGGVPCASPGELLLFRRSCLCRSLCAASGDLCLFLLSRGAAFCARCVAALAAAVARCVCPWRFRCAGVGSFWSALCVAVVLPTSATCDAFTGLRPAVSLLCPVVSYLRALVPLMCQLRWFCTRCFVVDWPGSPGVSEAVSVVT